MTRAWVRVVSPAMERLLAAGRGREVLRLARTGGGVVEVDGTIYHVRRARRRQRTLSDLRGEP